jgi:hypothetical protein
MKLVCINNKIKEGVVSPHEHITEGKVYEMISNKAIHIPSGIHMVNIISDNGKEVSLRMDRFKPLDEVRLEKLDELLK